MRLSLIKGDGKDVGGKKFPGQLKELYRGTVEEIKKDSPGIIK